MTSSSCRQDCRSRCRAAITAPPHRLLSIRRRIAVRAASARSSRRSPVCLPGGSSSFRASSSSGVSCSFILTSVPQMACVNIDTLRPSVSALRCATNGTPWPSSQYESSSATTTTPEHVRGSVDAPACHLDRHRDRRVHPRHGTGDALPQPPRRRCLWRPPSAAKDIVQRLTVEEAHRIMQRYRAFPIETCETKRRAYWMLADSGASSRLCR